MATLEVTREGEENLMVAEWPISENVVAEIEAVAAAATTPWVVAPESGFRVVDAGGRAALKQINETKFVVHPGFVYAGPAAQDIEDRLVENGMDRTEAAERVRAASTFVPTEDNPTDLASIPPFMRWFENSYGLHTLAAILHDEQISEDANAGSLGSDALADRYFREMLASSGVKWLKRWVMWSAVAMRSRWEAGFLRRSALTAWGAAALVGISSAAMVAGSWVGLGDPPIDSGLLGVIAVGLPFATAPLWGKQIGAGLIAAVVGIWLVPAGAFAFAGGAVYGASERVAAALGLD